ncbi:hypothetical protein C1645_835968 [Glomus cerebriforme]|uniref:Protein kinase domain-containing protein n=1 Tax=Glomus cerebriforme TaxID=658196 RepID=A0A397SB39_9GLOM|nr:hypothetical protein C1645_835968 [Glomus cerebriforme]
MNELNWIEDAISKKHIKYYEYDRFSNIQKIGSGAFGKVYRANWKNSELPLALNSLINLDTAIKELIHEHSSNVLIHQEDTIKLADLGLSKRIGKASKRKSKLLLSCGQPPFYVGECWDDMNNQMKMLIYNK